MIEFDHQVLIFGYNDSDQYLGIFVPVTGQQYTAEELIEFFAPCMDTCYLLAVTSSFTEEELHILAEDEGLEEAYELLRPYIMRAQSNEFEDGEVERVIPAVIQ